MADGTTAAPAAPTNGATKGEQPVAPDALKNKPDPKADFGEFVKKHGPVKYRVHNKERELTDYDALKQRLSFADAYEQKAQQEAERAQKAEARAARIEAAKRAQNPDEAWKALAEELGEENLYKLSEAQFLKLMAKEKEAQQLSPEARRWKEQAENAERAAQQREAELRRIQQETQQKQFDSQVAQVAEELDAIIGEGLADSGLHSESAAYFMPHVAAMIARAEEIGAEVTPQAIAQEVHRVQGEMAQAFIQKHQPKAIMEMLKKMVVPGENGAPNSNYLREVMRAFVANKSTAVEGETPFQPQAEEEKPRAPKNGKTKYIGGVLGGFRPPKF